MKGCRERGGVSIVVDDEGIARKWRCIGVMNGEMEGE